MASANWELVTRVRVRRSGPWWRNIVGVPEERTDPKTMAGVASSRGREALSDRGDDGVGVQVARRVATERLEVLALEFDDPREALDSWAGEDTVIVTHAISSGRRPGEIRVVDVGDHKLPAGNWATGGTHALGLAAVVELARTLDLMPRRLVVVGVEAAQLDHGAALSEAVEAALPAATDAVLSAIDAGRGRP